MASCMERLISHYPSNLQQATHAMLGVPGDCWTCLLLPDVIHNELAWLPQPGTWVAVPVPGGLLWAGFGLLMANAAPVSSGPQDAW